MFDSQAVETLIGLALVMFVVSLVASTTVETVSTALDKRGKELWRVVADLIEGKGASGEQDGTASHVLDTSVVKGIKSASRTAIRRKERLPSYLSTESFIDIVNERLQTDDPPSGVVERLTPVLAKYGEDLPAMQSALGRQFDEAMDRLSGTYKRWTKLWLFVAGVVIAVTANVSIFDTAQATWHSTPTRDALTQAAANVAPEGIDPSELESVAFTVQEIEDLGAPIGWSARAQATWDEFPTRLTGDQLQTALGWLVTGLLTVLGAQFWFDLLSRLVSLRGAGPKPPPGEHPTPDTLSANRPAPSTPTSLQDPVKDRIKRTWQRT